MSKPARITCKNLLLGLRDQLPLLRLIRNLFKGHVFGLFHKRSHYTVKGAEKIGYNTKETAIRSAQAMMKKRGVYYSNYRCVYCGKYHLGRNRDNKG